MDVDTNGYSREDKHFINTDEISVVKELIDGFLSMGIDDIIITTPYKQQERMFQFHLNNIKSNPKIRVGTIDEFQGQEAEVTIVSMARSNNHSDSEKAIGSPGHVLHFRGAKGRRLLSEIRIH